MNRPSDLTLLTDATCDYAPAVCAAISGENTVALQLRGEIGKRGRHAVLELEHLEFLDIRQLTGINNQWLAKLGKLPALRQLDAWRTCLGDVAAAGLAESKSLEAIDVRSTKITNDGLGLLASIPTLRYAQCSAGGSVPDLGLRDLARAPRMEHLAVIRPPYTFQSSWIEATTLEHIATARNLRSLSLFGVVGEGEALASLSGCSDLQELSLGSSYHRGNRKWLGSIASLHKVRNLDLSEIALREYRELTPLAEMKDLRGINLEKVSATDTTPPDCISVSIQTLVTDTPPPTWLKAAFPYARVVDGFGSASHLGVEGKLLLPADLQPPMCHAVTDCNQNA